MMTYLVMIALLAAATTLQLLAPALAGLGGVKPPLLLAVVLYYALNRGRNALLLAAVAAGILCDLHDTIPLGATALVFGLLGCLAARFQRVVLAESLVTAAVFGLLGNVIYEALTHLVLVRGGYPAWPTGRLLYRGLAAGVSGAVVTPLVFAAARCCDRVLGNIEVREVVDGIEQPLRR